jgi:glycine cleavage system aminomethyltransferase T
LSDPRAEHLATRRALGLFDFSFMGLYEIGGEASAVLDRVQTRTASRLEPGQLAYTLLLNEDGTVFIDATLWRLSAARWWLFTGRRSDFSRIAQSVRSVDGSARDRSGEYAVLALQGPHSGRALTRLAGEALVRELRYFRFVEGRLAQLPAVIGRLGFSGELGYEILVAARDTLAARQLLLAAGQELGVRECSFEAADSLRIESGYLMFDREIRGREDPYALGLGRLVERPCRARAHPAQRLVGLEVAERPAIAAAASDLPAARITSECDSPVLARRIALGFTQAQAAHPGTLVRLTDGRAARVARLPFYDPARRLPRARPL